MNAKILGLMALLTAVYLPAIRAEVSGSVSVEIRVGKALPPPPPPVVGIVDAPERPGPPPWARSRWFSRSRAYYYYPDRYVYYRPADRMWFYLEGSEWRAAAILPNHIDFDPRHSVALTMATDRPYSYHQKVVTYYGPDYFQRVKLKEEQDKGPDRGSEHAKGDEKHEPASHENDKKEGKDNDKGGGPGSGKGKGHDKEKEK